MQELSSNGANKRVPNLRALETINHQLMKITHFLPEGSYSDVQNGCFMMRINCNLVVVLVFVLQTHGFA